MTVPFSASAAASGSVSSAFSSGTTFINRIPRQRWASHYHSGDGQGRLLISRIAGLGKSSRYTVGGSATGSCRVRGNAKVHRLCRSLETHLIYLQPETRTAEQLAPIGPP